MEKSQLIDAIAKKIIVLNQDKKLLDPTEVQHRIKLHNLCMKNEIVDDVKKRVDELIKVQSTTKR